MIEKNKAIMSNQYKVISAEEDPDFEQLDVNNIVVVPPTSGSKYANIKYIYSNGKRRLLKIQTSELFSSGISKFNNEPSATPKMAFTLVDKSLREKENPTEEELMNIKVEDGTVAILDEITKQLRKLIKDPEMVKALDKQRDKKWSAKVDEMELVKRFTRDDGSVAINVWGKVVTDNAWMETEFMLLDEEKNSFRELDRTEVINKLLGETKCRATAIFVIDSIFIGDKPTIQMKVKEAVIKFIEPPKRRNIIMPARFRNRSAEKPKSKLYDSDSDDDSDAKPSDAKPKKVVVKDTSDASDSD